MEIVWVALINGLFGLIILVVQGRLNKKINSVGTAIHATKKEVTETKNEVKNSHTVNFRDDMDSKFDLTNNLIRGVQQDVARQARGLVSLRNTVTDHIEASAQREQEVRDELVAFRKTLGA